MPCRAMPGSGPAAGCRMLGDTALFQQRARRVFPTQRQDGTAQACTRGSASVMSVQARGASEAGGHHAARGLAQQRVATKPCKRPSKV